MDQPHREDRGREGEAFGMDSQKTLLVRCLVVEEQESESILHKGERISRSILELASKDLRFMN